MKFVILAGGHGKRLWPLSTKEKPKQFHAFLSERSLLQEAFDRLSFVEPSDIFVATNKEYVDLVREQLPELPVQNLISEPDLRDTAPCMSFATKYLESLFGPEETMSIIYADHRITELTTFEEKIREAHKIAEENGKITIVEVPAKDPNPNLGYVKLGQQLSPDTYELDRFTEKPDLATAQQFVESGNYLWNTGLYTWKIGTLLEYIEKFAPEISEILNKISDFHNCKPEYSSFPKISLDYALMEKIDPKNVIIVEADLGWSDIGTWETLFNEVASSPTENLIQANAHTADTTGTIIISEDKDKKIVISSQEDMVVVNTKDAILVCPRHESKKIKQILEEISKEP